ncbi:oligosaccharide repeat unit polymerase Wzy [Streptococcus criceti]|uniref:Polysaccharide polymerase n=1 Tax=Streptococcus criceti HS-6 TaxID=873449 RepID=G5JNF8_STRCG|nr:O-antigen polymerase [Streptococcus criceti]EHI75529.1 hypothetical protein STRCR_1413 [Streptococcus criceti HS-6]SUN43345.1 oligosaccharide repeat unit polymerase Wzy [Streptococcus criceti]
MLYLIAVVITLFLVFNLVVTKGDWLDPAVVFSAIFLMQVILCLLATNYLDLDFHAETFYILFVSQTVFAGFSLWNRSKKRNERLLMDLPTNSTPSLKALVTPKFITLFFVVLGIVLIYIKYRYLQQFSGVVGQSRASLSEKIALYDSFTKFNPRAYRALGISPPAITKYLDVLASSFAYLTAYSLVSNWVVNRKYQLSQFLYLFLFMIVVYFGGSRSGIFRLFTFIAFILYVLLIRNGADRLAMRKLLGRMGLVSLVLLILFFVSTNLFGRNFKGSNFHYLFIYVGAPLYNLDHFIQLNHLPIPQSYWGGQTFWGFYNWLLPKQGKLTYQLDLPFVQYSAQYGLGNVYTTFYQFIYDFGLYAVLPLISLIAWYYTSAYRKIRLTFSNQKAFDFRLFIYAYLFNDLFMLFFSNRFYETVVNFGTLKFLVCSYVLSWFISNDYLFFKKIPVHFKWK